MKPTRGLLQGMPYTSAAKTNLHKTFARIRKQQKEAKEAAERNIFRIVARVRA